MRKLALRGFWAMVVCAALSATASYAAPPDVVLYAADATRLTGNWTRGNRQHGGRWPAAVRCRQGLAVAGQRHCAAGRFDRVHLQRQRGHRLSRLGADARRGQQQVQRLVVRPVLRRRDRRRRTALPHRHHQRPHPQPAEQQQRETERLGLGRRRLLAGAAGHHLIQRDRRAHVAAADARRRRAGRPGRPEPGDLPHRQPGPALRRLDDHRQAGRRPGAGVHAIHGHAP